MYSIHCVLSLQTKSINTKSFEVFIVISYLKTDFQDISIVNSPVIKTMEKVNQYLDKAEKYLDDHPNFLTTGLAKAEQKCGVKRRYIIFGWYI